MQRVKNNSNLFWLAAALLLAFIIYYPDATYLWNYWMRSEEYSHGPLMLLISLSIAWNRRSLLRNPLEAGKWTGIALVIGSGLLYALAIKANIENLRQFSFIFIVLGLFLAAGGKNYGSFIAPSLLLLLLVIPLPFFLISNLSYSLQLFSSDTSVAMLRLSGVTVFQEGNIIDLGKLKLEVADACSGLRYLFPMMGIGILSAMIFDLGILKRLIIIAFATGVSIVTNIIRIYITGLLVDVVDLDVSQGFFHLLEGWLYFLFSLVIVGAFVYTLLTKKERATFGNGVLKVREGTPQTSDGSYTNKLIISTSILLLFLPVSYAIRSIQPVIPERIELTRFPLNISSWKANPEVLPSIEQDILQMTDYFLGNYRSPHDPGITLFISYYASQTRRKTPHSPRLCIPGGGWTIQSLESIFLQNADKKFPVSRAIIKKDDRQQLVYYWFQQKGRSFSNRHLARLNLLLNRLIYSRTDGALIRLSTSLEHTNDNRNADRRLKEFSQKLIDLLPPFLPI